MTTPYLTPASTFYHDLLEAIGREQIRDTYQEFGRMLRLLADQQTAFSGLHLGSLFAKVDYLCREHQLPASLTHSINDTRVRVRRMMALTDGELQDCRLYDLRALSLFVQALLGEPVPHELLRLFPEGRRKAVDSSVVAKYFRLYVTRHDDRYLYGRAEELPDEEEIRVGYNFRSQSLGGDWRYLAPYLHRGSQVNVVRPHLYQGIYYPELLILNPDYLVDISAITRCFADYAHSPLVMLIDQVRPSADTRHTMLGNLASQLLDEEVHNSGSEPRPYAESYADYIRSNTFSALTTDISSLYADGALQQTNIQRALHEGLAARIGRYDPTQVILEPSFISEMLGMQGRMDMLQLDYRVLLEQKSGKGEKPYGAPLSDPPRQKLPHYVQVLLYQAILNYNFEIPNRDIQALLLYSRYDNGLIGVSPAPELLKEAIALRNQLAGMAEMCSHGRGYPLLTYLTPEQLRTLPMGEKLWTDFIRPQLLDVLLPIQQASPVEQAYFLRFMQFIALEHTLSKVGYQTKENSGFAAKWHDSLEEKYQAGNIYDQLLLVSPEADHEGSVSRLVFEFPAERESDMSNFRVGDIVIVYPYQRGQEPDARTTMVFRGSIDEISTSRVCVALRAPQSHCHVFVRYAPQNYCWAIEHDFLESSSRSLYAGMHAFLQAPERRRQLLLLQRQPETDETLQLRGDYGRFNLLQLRVRQARDFFLIIGPPGTGKTSYGMLYTLQEQLLEPETNVLITSFTNRAVDEICSKLVEQHIPFVRVCSRTNCSAEYRPYLLDEQLAACSDLASMRQLLAQTRVIVSTTSSLASHTQLFRLKQFHLAIIDEASQILEPHLLPLLSARHGDAPAILRFVMIGDHKQLPAVVQQSERESMVEDPRLHEIGLTDCRLSLFERLLRRYRNDERVVYMLTRQGRMHQDIADFPNQAFYGGKLQVVPLEHQIEALPPVCTSNHGIDRLLSTRRIAFIASPLPQPIVSDKVNLVEAQLIAATAERIYRLNRDSFDPLATLGIIVPYRNQIAAVRNALAAYGHPGLETITIDTVERYQGSQRDYILYGFTIQRPHQLNFLTNNTFEEEGQLIDRKLNVAMTRARRHLLLFGNPQVIAENVLFARLLGYVRERGAFVEVEPERFVAGEF